MKSRVFYGHQYPDASASPPKRNNRAGKAYQRREGQYYQANFFPPFAVCLMAFLFDIKLIRNILMLGWDQCD